MKFRTEYPAIPSSLKLSPKKPVVLIGSCFSQNIKNKMTEHMWDSINPGGTLYNPVSISIAIGMMLDEATGKMQFEKTLFNYNGIWHSHMFDSSFSSDVKEDCVKEFIFQQQLFNDKLREGKVLIVTFGTSICYFLKEEKDPVGNCHTQPANIFVERRLEVEEIAETWNYLLKDLSLKFPDLRIIFTVSPVRHLKNGFVGNSRSKAILQLAVEKICRTNEMCDYFPAFEILNDDLRDYRFYASDLVHPSEEGINYIWEKFRETYIDAEGVRILNEGGKKVKALTHRPLLGALQRPIEKGTHP